MKRVCVVLFFSSVLILSACSSRKEQSVSAEHSAQEEQSERLFKRRPASDIQEDFHFNDVPNPASPYTNN